MGATLALVLAISLSGTPPLQSVAIGDLERDVAARPADVAGRQRLADAYAAAGRPMDAVAQLRRAAALAPRVPAIWYALGQAYNAVKQDALATFADPADEPWRQLLTADALLATGHFTDAFALYHLALDSLPATASIHDSLASIYARTGHQPWATRERATGRLTPDQCATRRALCEFRTGRYRAALAAALARSDAESRYWRARAANELALAAFTQLDLLPDSVERRSVRATRARSEERYTDAVAELKAALAFAPREPELIYELASAYYAARDFDAALGVMAPLLQAHPDDTRLLELQGRALLQLRRSDEAVPLLQRVVDRSPGDADARLALGRAHLQAGHFADAIPLIEEQLAADEDGSLHVQLARAYAGAGQKDRAEQLLAQSQDLQRAADQRRAAMARRTISAPK